MTAARDHLRARGQPRQAHGQARGYRGAQCDEQLRLGAPPAPSGPGRRSRPAARQSAAPAPPGGGAWGSSCCRCAGATSSSPRWSARHVGGSPARRAPGWGSPPPGRGRRACRPAGGRTDRARSRARRECRAAGNPSHSTTVRLAGVSGSAPRRSARNAGARSRVGQLRDAGAARAGLARSGRARRPGAGRPAPRA